MSNKPVCRILLVDDDPDVLRDYAAVLRRVGEVTEAADGVAALSHIASSHFDVIVSDVSMPRLTGIELLGLVRKYDLDVPVVLITGVPDLVSAMRALEYGAFGYLTKPISVEKLWQTVRRASEVHELARIRRRALSLSGNEGKALGDRASLHARFQPALESLWLAYQPIVDWRNKSVVGYEALVRSSEPSLEAPLDLLDAAERLDRLHELGQRIRAIIDSMAHEAMASVFFVNLHSADLSDPTLYEASGPLASIAARIVLEITERASLDRVKDVSSRVKDLRDMGFRIAIDDLGAGYAGLSSFAMLEPSFVKLDRSLIQGIDRSVPKQSIVRSIMKLCHGELDIQVICEGVETPEERDAVAAEGGDLMQGYLFGKPERELRAARW